MCAHTHIDVALTLHILECLAQMTVGTAHSESFAQGCCVDAAHCEEVAQGAPRRRGTL